jgi:hypothetical protein
MASGRCRQRIGCGALPHSTLVSMPSMAVRVKHIWAGPHRSREHALGLIPVKGLAEAVEVFELVGASAVRQRLQAAVARGLTRFVGREIEIDTLVQALVRASTGRGQVVATVGEAGVGKSRLLYEFVYSHRTQGWLVLEAASVSYGKANP